MAFFIIIHLQFEVEKHFFSALETSPPLP